MKLFESVGITPDVYEELLTPLEHGYIRECGIGDYFR
jgi:hypothetical protein